MLDLFEIVDKSKELHPNFKNICGDKYLTSVITEWSKDFEDRDNKFKIEFQTTFNSSFWELYCFAVFKKLGFKVDFKHIRPDFVMRYKEKDFNVECVVSNPAEGQMPEFNSEEKLNPTLSVYESVYNQTIRLRGSISAKHNKYKNDYSNLKHVAGKPFIIALAPFDQPNFIQTSLEAINMVMYGINADKNSFEELHIDSIHKNNNCKLDLGVFTNRNHSNISAVLFSNVATTGKARAISDFPNVIFNHLRYNESSTKAKVAVNYRAKGINYKIQKKDIEKKAKEIASDFRQNIDYERYSCRKPFCKEGYSETLTDGLHLYLNPYANHPIEEDILEEFKSNGVQIHSFNIEKHTMEHVYLSDGHLLQRKVLLIASSFK